MRGDGDAALARNACQNGNLRVGKLVGLLLLFDDSRNVFVRQVAIPFQRVGENKQIAVLPLAGRVIHERHEIDFA